MQPKPEDPANMITTIDLSDEVDVTLWAMVFGCTPGHLRQAVSEVGPDPRAVEEYMKREHIGMWSRDRD